MKDSRASDGQIKLSVIVFLTVVVWLVLLQVSPCDAQPVTKIAAGAHYSMLIKGGGSLWVMGYDNYGQLGDGLYWNSYHWTNRPEQIVASNVTAIAAGNWHSLFLKSDGSLWATGAGYSGQLGDGTYSGSTNRPKQVVASNVTAIAVGNNHSMFLKSDGSLWTMGHNYYGQLGDGNSSNTNWPEKIVASNVTAIAAGSNHSLFLKSDGSLWGMGCNSDGQLGDGTSGYGNQTNRPKQIVAGGVTAIATGPGAAHSLFLRSDGSLWAMGYNEQGQLGDGTYISTNRPEQIVASNVTAIAAGTLFSLFLKIDGSLWAMGYNYNGELGDGTYNNTNRPEKIVPCGVTAIAAGASHSLFLKTDGSLWGLGPNGYGELGDGLSTNRSVQILAPYNQISGQLLSGSKMRLSFVGVAGKNYALDRTFTLSAPAWLPQATNPADTVGVLVFTNTPNFAPNNFWRIRSVP